MLQINFRSWMDKIKINATLKVTDYFYSLLNRLSETSLIQQYSNHTHAIEFMLNKPVRLSITQMISLSLL